VTDVVVVRVDPPPERRVDARKRLATVDHLEQGRLLAEEVAARTFDDADPYRGRPLGGPDLFDGASYVGQLAAERPLQADDDLARIDRNRRDERALDDLVRVRS